MIAIRKAKRPAQQRTASAPAFGALLALLLSAVLLCAPGCSSAAGGSRALTQDSDIAHGVLDNGMSYYIKQNSEPANRLAVRLVVRAGSIQEDDDQQGVAHLVEHMAFNGSQHFKGRELVDFFESIGMGFGPEINAYTSFDETVYMLELPADNPEFLETALTVVYDWACALDFDAEKLETERSVVIEEWRLHLGVDDRVMQQQVPFMLPDSRYAQRMPIGKTDVIRNVSRERVIDFYKKWYRPDLMSVIIVGDAPAAELEQAVKQQLSAIPAPQEPLPRKEPAGVSTPREDALLVIRDPEITSTRIDIMAHKPPQQLKTARDVRQAMARAAAFNIFSQRMYELSLTAGSPLYAAGAGQQKLVEPVDLLFAAVIPTEGGFTQALDLLLTELERLDTFGVTESELARIKQAIIADEELRLANSAAQTNAAVVSQLLGAALYGDIVLSAQDRFDIYTAAAQSLTLQEVNEACRGWFPAAGKLMTVSAPENAADIPSDADIFAQWQAGADPALIVPYDDGVDDRPLYPEPPAAPGSIVSEQVLLTEPVTVAEWVLSNGVRVIANPTDFTQDEILMQAVRRGGLSMFPDEMFHSALAAADYVELSGLNGFSPMQIIKKLSGKQVSIVPVIAPYYSGLEASSSAADFEDVFRLVQLYFTAPEFTEDGWSQVIAGAELAAAENENTPQGQLRQAFLNLRYGDALRYQPLTKDAIQALDPAAAEQAYRACFSDADGYTFIFTGSFDMQQLREFACTYLAALPSAHVQGERAEPPLLDPDAAYVPFPQGTPSAAVYKGIEDQRSVYIAFGGTLPENDVDGVTLRRQRLEDMTQYLRTALRQTIREQLGGSYGVSVYTSTAQYPTPNYETHISFSCTPGREHELAAAVIAEIERLQQTLPTDADMTKITESYRRTMETNLEQNQFWAASIAQCVLDSVPLEQIADTARIEQDQTPQTLQQTLNQVLDTDNHISAFLYPDN